MGYEHLYSVNDCGEVFKHGKWKGSNKTKMIGYIDGGGYHNVKFRVSSRKSHLVHRLVAQAFLKDYDKNLTVDHLDGNKLNNNYQNLEMCTRSENTRRSWQRGYYGDI